MDAAVKPVACLLVDEAQFLEPAQVDDLLRIAVLQGVPVMAYGIRTDFPSALMERAAATGILAANRILRAAGAATEPVHSIRPRGLLARRAR